MEAQQNITNSVYGTLAQEASGRTNRKISPEREQMLKVECGQNGLTNSAAGEASPRKRHWSRGSGERHTAVWWKCSPDRINNGRCRRLRKPVGIRRSNGPTWLEWSRQGEGGLGKRTLCLRLPWIMLSLIRGPGRLNKGQRSWEGCNEG